MTLSQRHSESDPTDAASKTDVKTHYIPTLVGIDKIQPFLFPELNHTTERVLATKPTTILILDDEERTRQSLCDLLKPAGYQLTQAATVEQALRLLQTQTFALALVDLTLQDGNGQHVLAYAQKNNLKTRLIVISGETSFTTATEVLRCGACDYISKPYQPQTLLKTISKEIEKFQLRERYEDIQEQLKGSETLHKFIVNNSPDFIYMLDEKGRFSFINHRAESLLGCKKEQLIGQHYNIIVHAEDWEKAQFAFNERRSAERGSHNVELRLINHRHDEIRFVEARAIAVELTAMGVYQVTPDEGHNFIGTYGVIRDITERKRSEALRRYHQYHDQLTGLPNRALFHDRLQMALVQARRNRTKLAVLFLDIDRFKMVNENLGHLAGDKILQLVTKTLTNCLREEDTLARVGGDEFLLLLPNINKREDAAVIGHKIAELCMTPIKYQAQEVRVNFSIGIATYPEHGTEKDLLIRNADLAKCHIKRNGGNSHGYYCPHFDKLAAPALDLDNALHRALENNELELFYQPQIDIKRQQVTGVEALIRWNHPHKGLLSPALFIPLAEQSNLICMLGNWILDQACHDASILEQHGFTGLKVAINTSMQQLERGNFQQLVLRTIAQHKLDKNHIEIEITESNIMQDMQKAVEVLTSLATHGIGVAIDDFGTGYSSLSYLQTLPISTLKIDRSFIKNLSDDNSDAPIVTAVLTMAKALEMQCVVEGVETREQKEILEQVGCSTIQGYYYSKPLSLTNLMNFLGTFAKTGTEHN